MTTSCSRPWDDIPAWGTAPRAAFWLAVEQPGAWGKDAFAQSDLDPVLGKALESRAAENGGKAILVRRVHERTHEPTLRRVFLAGGDPVRPWLLAADVEDPAVLLDLPWDRLTATEPPMIEGFAPVAPVALVCTNGKRDQCCAVRGRPVATDAAATAPGQVWEATHLNGHRFAPLLVILPTMQLLAHADADDVTAALAAAARGEVFVDPVKDRGRTVHPAEIQVAEGFARVRWAEPGLAAVTTQLAERAERVEALVTHVDGRTLRVAVTKRDHGIALPLSCGKAPEPVTSWEAVEV